MRDEFCEMVSAYIDNELSDSDTVAFLEHLKTCTECKSLCNMFTLLSDEMDNTIVPAPDLLAPGIMYKLSLETNKKRHPLALFGRYTAAAAAIIIISFAASKLINNNSSNNAALNGDAADFAASPAAMSLVSGTEEGSGLMMFEISPEDDASVQEHPPLILEDNNSDAELDFGGTSSSAYEFSSRLDATAIPPSVPGTPGTAKAIMDINNYSGLYYALAIISGSTPDWLLQYERLSQNTAGEAFFVVPAAELERHVYDGGFVDFLYDNTDLPFALIAVLPG